MAELTTGHGWVRALAIGVAGGRDVIVSGGDDGALRIWDAATCEAISEPLTGGDWVRAVAIGRVDGRDVVVSGGDDRVAACGRALLRLRHAT